MAIKHQRRAPGTSKIVPSTTDRVIRATDAVEEILRCIGDDPDRDGLKETPERVVRSWEKLFGGYKQDPSTILKTFEDDCDEIVLLRNVEMYSCCEHHLQPFFGQAHVAYIPDGRVVGISKLARLVEVFSRRLQIQERICQQVVGALMEHLKPKAAACVIEAKHFCMTSRGVEKQNSVMVTSALAGLFKGDRAARSELMRLIGK